MDSFHTSPIKFSGYRLTQGGEQARVFLPGNANSDVKAEAVLPGEESAKALPLKRQGDYWVSSQPVPLGTAYRFSIDGNPSLDYLEVTQRNGEEFNLVSPHESQAPQKSVVIADIFLDSLVTREKLAELAKANGGVLPMRNHFNQFYGNEQALNQLMPQLREAGFTSLLFKPFIGGDNLSAHKYWTIDPYVLNNSFSSKAAFKTYLNSMLGNGMKLFADGAFVNQGLNGAQFVSNIAHGFRSPYWDWFTYEEDAKPAGQIEFPKHAYEGYNLGVLPTALDAEGHRDIAYDRFDIRVINDPRKSDFDAKEHTYIELYDPTRETADGKAVASDTPVKTSEDSVQNYRFPVSPEEVKKKFAELAEQKDLTDAERKQQLLEWGSYRDSGRVAFKLDRAAVDDSAFKWDGQIDVAKMNMKNPEVVEYLENAVGYWTRYVQNTYTDTVTRALVKARTGHAKQDPTDWLNAITQSGPKNGKSVAAKPNQVLPPITLPDVEKISAAEAKEIVDSVHADVDAKKTGAALADTILTEYPIMAQPLPDIFKATLSHPDLNKLLTESTGGPFALLGKLIAPLSHLPLIGPVFGKLKETFLPSTFQQKLEATINDITDRISDKQQDKLRYAKIRSLVADALGEAIYLQLFTGQTSEDPKAIEAGFYKTVPQAIAKSDPETAAKLLPRFLKQRLASLDATAIANKLEKNLAGLDPQLAVLAERVLQQREYGLNWRIDAAKDVADMDRVKNLDPQDRPAAFEEEIGFVKEFWLRVGGKVREVFPKSTMIAELTDFGKLSNKDVEKKAMGELFENNVFTSTPNMSYMYSPVSEFVGYAPRPDEFGANQSTPNQFIDKVLKPMSQKVSFPTQRQYQNLTSSHDYATTSHVLMLNTALYTMDHLSWWGLKDDLLQSTTELGEKACFAGEREQLQQAGIGDIGGLMNRLNELANDPKVRAKLSPTVQNYVDQPAKEANDKAHFEPTPFELKGRFVHELFAAIKPADLGLTKEQAALAEQFLAERMEEHSEAKALRGVISNALLSVSAADVKLSDDQKQAFDRDFSKALTTTINEWGRPFGAQPMDVALDSVFKKLPANWSEDLKADIKSQMYAHATKPVLSQLLRAFAVQNAIPGNPSVYMPDLFNQGGSEWLKNIFLQNRSLIRVDKLAEDADFQAFFKATGEIFKTRQQLPALNNGVILPVPGDDENGILPIVRDNGQQQVVTLINSGKASGVDWNVKVGHGERYTEVRSTQPVLKNYQPDLSALKMEPGTRYQDVNTKEIFTLNGEGKLASANGQGMDIAISRTLVKL